MKGTTKAIRTFSQALEGEERSAGTIEKYVRDVRSFLRWLGDQPLSKDTAAAWKDHLVAAGYAPATVNSMLAALNRFFRHCGREDCRVKFLKVQRRLFRDSARDLSRREYDRLILAAQEAGRQRLALLIETMGSTGIRVSEVKYITLEAVRRGRAEVALKGKIRTILIPGKLCRKLQKYAGKEKIASGEIFLTGSGRGLTRRQIWAEMKSLCRRAGVEASKVFPHNLRHLFARTFYRASRNLVQLADVLGHSSVETTRVYLIATEREHAKQLESLGLVR